MQKKKINRIFNILVKLLFLSVFTVLIYRQVFINNDPTVLFREFKDSVQSDKIYLFIIAVLLAFANWSLEAAKWKLLMSQYYNFGFVYSLKTIFAGIAGGIITPMQLGEYFGRVVSVDGVQKWRSFWATLIGSIAQNIFTIFFGITGLLLLLKNHYKVDTFILYPSFLLGIGGVMILTFIYFNVGIILKIASRLGMNKLVQKIVSKGPHPNQSMKLLNKVLMFSLMRYLVFTAQFYLLLVFFGMENNVMALLSGISSIFFLQTGIPLPSALNFLVRGEISIIVFQHLNSNEILIIASTFSLWFINLVIPSILGLLVLMKINIIKSFGYDD